MDHIYLENRMKIVITRTCYVSGVPKTRGDKMDVAEREGKYLISIGRAVAADPEAAGDAAGPGPLETADAEAIIETAEKPKTKGK